MASSKVTKRKSAAAARKQRLELSGLSLELSGLSLGSAVASAVRTSSEIELINGDIPSLVRQRAGRQIVILHRLLENIYFPLFGPERAIREFREAAQRYGKIALLEAHGPYVSDAKCDEMISKLLDRILAVSRVSGRASELVTRAAARKELAREIC
jgi:hypothetical protein